MLQTVKKSACNTGDPGSIPGLESLLEEEMATHSSILAWRAPRTEEPGGLQSTELQSRKQLSDPHSYLFREISLKLITKTLLS